MNNERRPIVTLRYLFIITAMTSVPPVLLPSRKMIPQATPFNAAPNTDARNLSEIKGVSPKYIWPK